MRRTPKVPRLVFPPSRWARRAGAGVAAGPPTAAMGGPFVAGGEGGGTGTDMMVKEQKKSRVGRDESRRIRQGGYRVLRARKINMD